MSTKRMSCSKAASSLMPSSSRARNRSRTAGCSAISSRRIDMDAGCQGGEFLGGRPLKAMEVRTAHGLGRLVGLALRRDRGVALLLPRCRSVHTFGMRFALDLVWLDGAGEVVRVDRGVPPYRVRSCRGARS